MAFLNKLYLTIVIFLYCLVGYTITLNVSSSIITTNNNISSSTILIAATPAINSVVINNVVSTTMVNNIVNVTQAIQLTNMTLPSSYSNSSSNSPVNVGNTDSLSSIAMSIDPTVMVSLASSSMLMTGIPATTFDPRCVGKEDWDTNIYQTAIKSFCEKSATCTDSLLTTFNLYIKCNSHSKPEEAQFIGGTVNIFLLLRAEEIFVVRHAIKEAIISDIEVREHFSTQFGFIQKDFLPISVPVTFKFDDDNILQFPETEFEEEQTKFVFSVFKNVYRIENDPKVTRVISPLLEAVGALDPSILPEHQDIEYKMNSDIISFNFDKAKVLQRDFAEITMKLIDRFQTKHHKCIVLVGRLGSGLWQDNLCHIFKDQSTSVVCRCKQLTGHFAVLSEIDVPPPADFVLERDSITFVFLVICCIVFFICLLSFALPFMFGCNHLGGMLRVYRYSDLTFMIYYGVFLYGVYHSDDIDKAKIVAAVLHFLHHAVMMWVIAEGIHVYHGMNPLYSDATGMIFFYSTIVFGVAAALAGSGAGYAFEITGKAQYVWAFGNGIDAIYFLIPTVVIIVILILFDSLLVYELMSWIGSKSDYLYARAGKYLTRSIGYTLVYSCTNVFGVMSMQSDGGGFMAYLFMGFMAIQAICMFYSHFVSNFEVWSWKEEQDAGKELQQEEGFTNLEEEGDDEDNNDRESDKGNNTTPSKVSKISTSRANASHNDSNSSQVQLIREDSKPNASMSRTALRNSRKSLKNNTEGTERSPSQATETPPSQSTSPTELLRNESRQSTKAPEEKSEELPEKNTTGIKNRGYSPESESGSQVELIR